ncbi:MAG: aminotransferase class IV [Flavobacterium sp.]
MLNFNGTLVDHEATPMLNRGFSYGDAVFETIKMNHGKMLFWEDHYFRLMASMRILRMKIPMDFTMEFIEQQILSLVKAQNLENARIRMTVYRNQGGFYLPKTNEISYIIEAHALPTIIFAAADVYEVELFKDFHIGKHLLSTLKTTNKLIQITASIFAEENGYQSCLLMNDDKNIVEAISGNLFMVTHNTIVTPPLSEGCLNGIMRKQIIALLKKNVTFQWEERAISPFELQKADELFITNVIVGIQPITKYRKKNYATSVSKQLTVMLNELISLP